MRKQITGMVHRVVVMALLSAVLWGMAAPLCAGVTLSDSIAYTRMREKMPAVDSLRLLIETADALAGQGLYAEAMDMIRTLGPRDSVRATSQRTGKWRVSTGADYYHLEDIDTVIMTQDEYLAYQRLTETPLSVWARAKYETVAPFGIFDKAAPEISISTYKGRIEVPVRMHAVKNLLSIETAIKADKWFRADASNQASFEPVKNHPSDMAGASLRIVPGSLFDPAAAWSWAVPGSVEWEQYRIDRPGYESSADFRVTPMAEHRFKGALPLLTRITGEARYDDYYKKESDSLSALRMMARLENILSCPDGMYANLTAVWLGDRYTNTHAPAVVDRWESSLRAEYGILKWLVPGMSIRGMHQKESYDRTDSTGEFSLPGAELWVRPSARFFLTNAISLEPEITWNRRWSEQRNVCAIPRFIWESYSAWEPGLRIGLTSFNMDLSARAGYRAEDVDEMYETYIRDSRSIKASVDGTIALLETVSINVFVDYQYSIFDPYEYGGRETENLTVSGSIAFKW
jgi:hypothetical protein